jgi:hypothetical protein
LQKHEQCHNQHSNGQIERPEFMRNFPMGSSASLLEPERVHQISYGGVAKLIHPLLDPTLKKQKPDREETGRAPMIGYRCCCQALAGNVPGMSG